MAALPRAIAPSLAADGDLVLLGDLDSMGCRGCAPRTGVADENCALEAELAAAGMVRVAPTQPCSEYASLRCGRLPRGPHCAPLIRLSDHCPIVLELADVDRDP